MPPRIDFTSQRLHHDAALAEGATVDLDRDQANYLLNVLRMREGDGLLVFNGRDGEWRASVASADRKRASLVVGRRTRPQPPASRIVLCFAPVKHLRLDYLVQKAVEMGAGKLVAIATARTQTGVRNPDRLKANIIEAAEQCGVLALPQFMGEIRLENLFRLFDEVRAPWIVFCDEMAETADPTAALKAIPADGSEIAILIGPEGGFSPLERETVRAWPRAIPISLGPRILRADTAVVAALAAVQMAVGDWR